MLQIQSLSKKFRDFEVLKEIYLKAEKGQIYGLVGSNGCGKTTLLKHIIQVYKQDKGEIYYDDNLITEKSEEIKDFYYIQDDLFFPHGSTLQSLYNYEKLLYKNMSKEKFDKLADYFNVDINKKLSNMSKGQKRQAAFVLSMASNCKVLLLDEIVDGLDAVVRRKFWSVLIKEVIENDIIVIISSHALKELDNICNRIGIMHEGKIIKEEEMDMLKENIKRVQFAIDGEFEDMTGDLFNIIKSVKIGSVYFTTIKGSIEEFEKSIRDKYKVLLFNELPVNLEEIFITELGGAGYGMEELDS